MRYELLEWQWISDSNYGQEDSASNRFNKFSRENNGKFEVVHMTTVVHLNNEGKTVETTFIMIKWLN